MILIDIKKRDHTKEAFEIEDTVIKASPLVKLLGVHIDDKISFNLYIFNIRRSVANQLNDLIRLKPFLSFEATKVLVNSYFHSNFSYYPLVLIFSSANLWIK